MRSGGGSGGEAPGSRASWRSLTARGRRRRRGGAAWGGTARHERLGSGRLCSASASPRAGLRARGLRGGACAARGLRGRARRGRGLRGGGLRGEACVGGLLRCVMGKRSEIRVGGFGVSARPGRTCRVGGVGGAGPTSSTRPSRVIVAGPAASARASRRSPPRRPARRPISLITSSSPATNPANTTTMISAADVMIRPDRCSPIDHGPVVAPPRRAAPPRSGPAGTPRSPSPARTRTRARRGIAVSTPPGERTRASPSRRPSWNTHTITPNEAPSEITLMNSALNGTTTDPVMRNSSTNVASTTMRTASGVCARRSCNRSTSTAAGPVVYVGKPGSICRIDATTFFAVCELSVPATRTFITVAKPRSASPCSSGPSTRMTPGMPEISRTSGHTGPWMSVPQSFVDRTCDGQTTPIRASATTWTGACAANGKRFWIVSSSCRCAESAGSSPVPDTIGCSGCRLLGQAGIFQKPEDLDRRLQIWNDFKSGIL